MWVELISDQQELMDALRSCQHRRDSSVMKSFAAKQRMRSSPIAGLTIYDARQRTRREINDFLDHHSASASHVLLITAPEQNLHELLATVTFKGTLDAIPWPVPPNTLSFRLDLIRHDLLVEARRKAERQRTSRDAAKLSRLHTIAEDAPFLMLAWDAKGYFRYANAKARAFFGLSARIDPHTDWLAWVHHDDQEQLRKEFTPALKDPASFTGTARLRRADGNWRWMNIAGGPQFDPLGVSLAWRWC